MIGTIVKGKVGYEWLSLTKEEIEKTLDELRQRNAEEFTRCLDMAKDICEIKGEYLMGSQPEILEVAKMLFEKQATQSYTVLSNALDRKKFNQKKKQATQSIYEIKGEYLMGSQPEILEVAKMLFDEPERDESFKPAITKMPAEKVKEIVEKTKLPEIPTQKDMRSMIDKAFEPYDMKKMHTCTKCGIPWKTKQALDEHICSK